MHFIRSAVNDAFFHALTLQWDWPTIPTMTLLIGEHLRLEPWSGRFTNDVIPRHTDNMCRHLDSCPRVSTSGPRELGPLGTAANMLVFSCWFSALVGPGGST